MSAQRRRSARITNDVRISKHHPTVYLTFERIGKREPRRVGESSNGVWLRLHNNNTRWPVDVQAYGLPDPVFTKVKETEIGFFYKVATASPPITRYRDFSNPSIEEEQKCTVPVMTYSDLRSVIEITPGESKLFSVAQEHLCRNLYIFVNFRYAWERESFDDPQHSVLFYGSEIPALNRTVVELKLHHLNSWRRLVHSFESNQCGIETAELEAHRSRLIRLESNQHGIETHV